MGTPPTVTSFTTRLEINSAELAAVEKVMVSLSSVTVPIGSLADAPTIDQTPSHVSTGGYLGSGSGFRPRLARKPKSQPSLA